MQTNVLLLKNVSNVLLVVSIKGVVRIWRHTISSFPVLVLSEVTLWYHSCLRYFICTILYHCNAKNSKKDLSDSPNTKLLCCTKKLDHLTNMKIFPHLCWTHQLLGKVIVENSWYLHFITLQWMIITSGNESEWLSN